MRDGVGVSGVYCGGEWCSGVELMFIVGVRCCGGVGASGVYIGGEGCSRVVLL